MLSDRIASALRAHPWFGEVQDLNLRALATRSCWLRFAIGQEIFVQGQPCRECLLIGSGEAQGLRYTAAGEEKVFGHARSGAFVAIQSLFVQPQRHWHTVRASAAGEGVLIGHEPLRTLCLTEPRVALRVIEQGARLVQHHTEQIDWLTSSTAEQRLAEYILRFGDALDAGEVQLPLRWSQVATKLGIRAETVSRLLSKWERKGYVSNCRTRLLVLQADALRQMVTEVMP
ncbi:MAG: Crp/Fnr family transcriptional regulator [Burkholderiaceae bacterium]|jgi:CRP/FNR family transcriptional regulator|nr:Crp/Fnr family transcriptional regulator [Burkholderiaceae bacterium]